MDKLAKLRFLISEEKEIDWLFGYKTCEVRDMQSYIRGMWDDSASRYLWTRYAIPFENDTAVILQEKEILIARSQEIADNGNRLFDNCIKVQSFSEDISDLLKDAQKEQTSSAHSLADGQKFYERVDYLLPQVDSSLESLNGDQLGFQDLIAKRRRVYSSW